MINTNEPCACSAAPTLIFACSGSADVGALADQTGRHLMRQGSGKMFCLAGVGGRVSGIMKTTEAADDILVIDGCPLDCAKNCLQQAGFSSFKHLQLADMGFRKGETEVSDANIVRATSAAVELLTD